MGERPGEVGQAGQRAGDADLLARGAEVEAGPPREPLGAGAEAVVPPALGIEPSDEVEQAGGGGAKVCGQFRDLVADALNGAVVHEPVPLCWDDSNPGFPERP